MDATTEVHTQEENQGSRRAVGRARVTPDGCKLGMASRHHVSLALEEEIEHNQEKRVYAPPQLPEKLHRRAALEQDAAFWYGPAGRSACRMRRPPSSLCGDPKSSSCWWPTPTPATWATHLGCHVLKKIAQKALGLSSSGGPGLCTFPNMTSATEFKQRVVWLPHEHSREDPRGGAEGPARGQDRLPRQHAAV